MKRKVHTKRTPDRGKRSRSRVDAPFAIETHRVMALLSLATLVPMSLIFEPISWWPLSFVCLVPWLILVGGASRAPRVYFHSYVLALAFFLLNMRWLYAATGLGYVVLSIYLAVYFPLVALPVRHVVRRRRWPLALALPLVWTGSEMLRAVVISGFPWFFLSHSLHHVLTLIQVSDLVGAYGVSFMVAAVNGAIGDVVFATIASRRAGGSGVNLRGSRFSVAFAAVLVIGVAIYGQIQLHRDTTTDGPKIAVIQGDYINTVYPEQVKDHDRATDQEKMRVHLSMMETAAKEKPDMYLLPETPWIMYLNPEARDFFPLARSSFAALQEHATRHNAVVVTGSATLIPTPNDLLAEERRYNSATVFTPDGAEPQRYDKIHLVYFGEVVPFRFTRLHFLYLWLHRFTPFTGPEDQIEYSLFRGDAFRQFTLKAPSQGGRAYRFGVPICYEDVMPYVSREFTCGGSDEKRVDLLLNISNDGWFGRGIQQPQHLAICAFRAVENRLGIARAVNTGISGFIEPSGRVHDLVTGDPSTPWPGNCGYTVATVGVDSRYTLYSRYGDWFAWSCALMWLLLFVDYWIARARTHAVE
ncbi:MAG: apolipoprotein N-acyltransferase [Phycisphaerae bacterium]